MTDPRPQMIRDGVADESDLYDLPLIGTMTARQIQGITTSGWYIADFQTNWFHGPFDTQSEALGAINENDPITPLTKAQTMVCEINVLN